MTDRPLLPARQQKTMFSTLQVRVLSIRCEMAETQRGAEQNEAVWNGLIALGMQGMTQTSKPIKMSVNESVNVPEAVYSFDMQGHTYSSLLAVKFLLLKRREPVPPGHPERPPQTEELGNGDVDISMVAQAGGDRVVSCKVSSSDPAKRPSEVFLHVRIIMRRADFQFSYLGDCPVFKKAGFVISSRGLMKCPHVFKKKGLPHEKTMRDLEVLADVTKEEAAPEGMRVLRAHIHGHSHKYTVKRYQVMQTNARRMLISELDGLMDCPSHLAVSPLDAFLEGLEVAIVFDDNGGRYLSEVVGTRSKFSEMNLSIVVRQVLNALRFLHETKLRIHNDIDPRNILVLRSGEVRLSGFGYSSKNTNAHSKANKFAGPFVHMSPERLLGLECSYAADVWSVGILAMTLLHGKPPYNMSQYSGPDALFKFKQMIVTEHSPSIPRGDEYSDEVRLFVDSCLHKNIKLRPTVSALITHSFIATWDGYHNNVLGRWISKNEIRSFQRPVKEVPEEIPKMTFRGQPVSDELAHVVRTADSPP
jgi:serine/threonine protein kinase